MKKIVIVLIIILATVLRFYKLDSLPALNADEAAIVYNAHSLLETGKDEHSNTWPIHFQSFNDYKPGLYFYLVMPFVKVFGLNEWAVRIPGATLGVGTVFLVWLLVKELFPDKKWLPEISAIFLAISPWHLHFSRGGWEANAGTFFMALGFWGFLKSTKKQKWLLVSAISWIAALYTYHSARIVVPLLALGLLIKFRKAVLGKNKKVFFATLVMSLVLILPLAKDLLGPAGISRASGVGLLADLGPTSKTDEQRGEHDNPTSLSTKLLHNKGVNYGLAFARNYMEHFDGNFLFISGDLIQRNKVPEMGTMYMFDLIFLIAGLLAIAKNGKGWFPILLWLVVAPIPAALTFQSPHALRAQNMIVPLTVISAYGLWNIATWLQRLKNNHGLFVICHLSFVIFIFWDFTRYLHNYYVHMPKTYDYSSQYGVKELVLFTKEQANNKQFLVTTRYDQPYILFLFYLKYPPDKFQAEHSLTSRDKFGFSTVESFDRYSFGLDSDWETTIAKYPKYTIAGSPEEVPDGANVSKEIYFPSGRTAFKIMTFSAD